MFKADFCIKEAYKYMRFRISTKIGLVFGIFSIGILIFMLAYVFVARQQDYYTKELQEQIEKLDLSKMLERGFLQLVITEDNIEKKAEVYNRISISIEELITELYQLEIDKIEERGLLNYVTEEYARLKKMALSIFESYTAMDEATQMQVLGEINSRASNALRVAEKFHQFVYESIGVLRSAQERTKYLLYLIVFGGICLNILLILGSIIFFRNTISTPILNLRNSVLEVGKGNLNKKFNIQLKDEVGELANAFNNMVENLKNTQIQLVQAEKLASLGQLSAGIAHEIKNPLSIIIQGVEYIQSYINDEHSLDALDRIKKAAHRADKIVIDLLDYAHPTLPTFEKIDINAAIEETLLFLKYQLDLSNVEIVRNFSNDLPKVTIDTNLIKQVFINIIFNAIDAMPQGGAITISTEKLNSTDKKNYVQVTFSDIGCGINEENMDKVFDPFFSTKRKKQNSSGLGLAVTKGIIERHNGKIKIDSNVNQGTKVAIMLPIT